MARRATLPTPARNVARCSPLVTHDGAVRRPVVAGADGAGGNMRQGVDGTGTTMPSRWAELGSPHEGADVLPATMGAAGLGLLGLAAGLGLLIGWLAGPDPDGTALVRGPVVVMGLTVYGLAAGAIGGGAASWSAARWARGRRPASLPLLAAGTATAMPPLLVPAGRLATPMLYLMLFSGIWLTSHLLLDRVARRRAALRR
jgi:hypothetical protein